MTNIMSKVIFLLLNLCFVSISFSSYITAEPIGTNDEPDLNLIIFPSEVVKGLIYEQVNFTLFLTAPDNYEDKTVKIYFETNARFFTFETSDGDEDLKIGDNFVIYNVQESSNLTVSFSSSLLGIYHIRFYTLVNGIEGTKNYFDER